MEVAKIWTLFKTPYDHARTIFQNFDDEALASVDARRNAAISDIGLSHGTVAKQIADFRGLMKANFQLDGSSQFGI